MREQYPLVEHPVVARHAETGRRHLYVNRYFTSRIEGYEPDRSVALIDRLAAADVTTPASGPATAFGILVSRLPPVSPLHPVRRSEPGAAMLEQRCSVFAPLRYDPCHVTPTRG